MYRDLKKNHCARCKVIPEDILILSCKHNLCLDCAAISLCHDQSSVFYVVDEVVY